VSSVSAPGAEISYIGLKNANINDVNEQ